jgi:hypothetical protein
VVGEGEVVRDEEDAGKSVVEQQDRRRQFPSISFSICLVSVNLDLGILKLEG